MPTIYNAYYVPTSVRLSFDFTDSAGDYYDPDTVTLRVVEPDGTETEYVYGTDAEVVKEAIGQYYADINFTQAGRTYYSALDTTSGGVTRVREEKYLLMQEGEAG